MLMRQKMGKLCSWPVTSIKSSDRANWPAVRKLSHAILQLRQDAKPAPTDDKHMTALWILNITAHPAT